MHKIEQSIHEPEEIGRHFTDDDWSWLFKHLMILRSHLQCKQNNPLISIIYGQTFLEKFKEIPTNLKTEQEVLKHIDAE